MLDLSISTVRIGTYFVVAVRDGVYGVAQCMDMVTERMSGDCLAVAYGNIKGRPTTAEAKAVDVGCFMRSTGSHAAPNGSERGGSGRWGRGGERRGCRRRRWGGGGEEEGGSEDEGLGDGEEGEGEVVLGDVGGDATKEGGTETGGVEKEVAGRGGPESREDIEECGLAVADDGEDLAGRVVKEMSRRMKVGDGDGVL
ncbi:hypothetical protein J5N97_013481 [Dioscorea zingiberensis]|uniref:Uncharacterized protein n=1 Tax=Dioscorea zingiberensis TaxID=325984 RepID=A0A9D5CS84_9LILI|nr:hypothetical protein J5N97_013481 [Dioscorea zingiberensis]